MKQTHKQWFTAVPWDSVCTVNQALCRAQKVDPLTNLRLGAADLRRGDAKAVGY